MASDLTSRLIQIEVDGTNFGTMKDKMMAESFLRMYTCQAVLQSAADFIKAGNLLNGHQKYLTITPALINNSSDEWIQVFVQGFNDSNTASICTGSLKNLLLLCHTPAFSNKMENYVYTADDFPGVSWRGQAILRTLRILMTRIVQLEMVQSNDKQGALRNVAYFCVHLISRHVHVNAWTESETSISAIECQKFAVESLCVRSVSDLLVLDLKSVAMSSDVVMTNQTHGDNQNTLLGKLINELKPLLLKTTWQQNPGAATSFCWCVENLKFPHMSNFLEVLLPPSLLFVDDHITENKVCGVKCLMFIIENTSREELRWYGRADVVYEALKHQLYSTEEVVLQLAHKALLLILQVLVKDSLQIAATTKYDEILLMMMQDAAHENKLYLRRTRTQHIHTYINQIGINVVKYIQKILDLAEEYLEIADPPNEEARINILKALAGLLKNAWPRMHCQSFRIIKMLVKLLHQISQPQSCVLSESRAELITMSVDSLELLKALDNETVTKSLTALSELPLAPACVACLNNVLSSAQG